MSRKIAILLLLLAWLPVACGGKKINLDPKKMSDKQLYETGLAEMKKGDYAQARDALKIVYESFPQSEYRILARIEYADSYYKEGGMANYILAIQEYQDFISLFPFSPKAEYAQFMVGMCYYQMIEKPDRDQTQTRKALDEFRKVVDTYPNGQYYHKAYEYLLKCYSHLAEHEYLIARYYERTGRYQAAIDRLKGLLKAYPESVHEPKFIYSLAHSLQELHQFNESCTLYDQLLQKWPTSELAGDAKENKVKVCKDLNRASS
jgi:outer membrane protein assembly factor BamD